jgi:tRNA(Ile)-lysidine synthase TilS/MesJ
LLDWKKTDIYTECNRLGIPYREDSTNADTKYLRNWYRHNMDTDQYTDLVGSICDRVQKVLPKLNRLSEVHFADTVKLERNKLFISKTITPDALLLLHLNNILSGRLSITESVFERMFSSEASTNYFDIKRNIKCNKRKKNWIILEFA